jgi:hypothetical protein
MRRRLAGRNRVKKIIIIEPDGGFCRADAGCRHCCGFPTGPGHTVQDNYHQAEALQHQKVVFKPNQVIEYT